MNKYPGGCAIMLKMPTAPCEIFENEALHWVAGLGQEEHKKDWKIAHPDDYHLTLQFVGRNLDGDKIGAMIYSAFLFAREPFTAPVEFTGTLGMLSTLKGRYLVAHVNGKPLEEARNKLESTLLEMGVVAKDPFRFGFSPHVTLAEASPDAPRAKPPPPVGPFSVQVKELVVKYGPYRMVVEL